MTEPTTSAPRSCVPRCLPLLGLALVLLLGLGGLGFFGWCWGYWGRGNALFQALWQCQCPVASEVARYPAFTLLASACTNTTLLDLSPSSRFALLYHERPQRQIVRLDLTTGQRRVVVQQGRARAEFVTDDLVLIRPVTWYPEYYPLYDLTDSSVTNIPARQVPVQPEEGLDRQMLTLLARAQRIFVLGSVETVILSQDYKRQPEQALVLYTNTDSSDQVRVKQLLTAAGIAYEEVTTGLQGTWEFVPGRNAEVLMRPDRQQWVDALGVYAAPAGRLLVSTQQDSIAPRRQMQPYSWVRAGQAVLYGRADASHLIDDTFWSFLPIPQPILLLEVPE